MKTVLVIDDEALVRDTFARIVTREGCRVLQAADGMAALRCLEQESVDLVVCDLHMPGKAGFETINAIRRLRPTLKIIGMSGSGEYRLLELMKAAGADFILPKPFLRAELTALLRRCFETRD